MLDQERNTPRYWRRYIKRLTTRKQHAAIVLGELYEQATNQAAATGQSDRAWARYQEAADYFVKDLRFCNRQIARCEAELAWLAACVSEEEN